MKNLNKKRRNGVRKAVAALWRNGRSLGGNVLRASGICAAERPEYWEGRRQYNYYSTALRMMRKYGQNAESVLDVGPLDSEVLLDLDWIQDKTAIDLEVLPKLAGVRNIHGDFLSYDPGRAYDLVLCLQVLEHLREPVAFMDKLLHTGKYVIVSVPYLWPAGLCKWHIQDPVSIETLRDWSGCDFMEHEIARDGDRDRLIAVYRGLG